MALDARLISPAGLEFFGKVCAAISHDIKNVLAVINENGGLLEDLCHMAEKGRPIDPSRLKRLAGDVRQQVRRADGIISAMNRFAHSADEPSAESDLVELIGLLGLLAKRLAALRGVVIQTPVPSVPVLVTTFPFGLLNLLWICLDCTMTASGSGRTVELIAEKTPDGAVIRFRRLDQIDVALIAAIVLDRTSAMSQALNAAISADERSSELVVRLPKGGSVQPTPA